MNTCTWKLISIACSCDNSSDITPFNLHSKTVVFPFNTNYVWVVSYNYEKEIDKWTKNWVIQQQKFTAQSASWSISSAAEDRPDNLPVDPKIQVTTDFASTSTCTRTKQKAAGENEKADDLSSLELASHVFKNTDVYLPSATSNLEENTDSQSSKLDQFSSRCQDTQLKDMEDVPCNDQNNVDTMHRKRVKTQQIGQKIRKNCSNIQDKSTNWSPETFKCQKDERYMRWKEVLLKVFDKDFWRHTKKLLQELLAVRLLSKTTVYFAWLRWISKATILLYWKRDQGEQTLALIFRSRERK